MDDYSSFYDEESDNADGYIDYPSRLRRRKNVLREESKGEAGEKQTDC